MMPGPLDPGPTQEALGLAEQGKRVFLHCAQLSFLEKEAKVLSYLEGQASFCHYRHALCAMTRYFILNQF